MAKAAKFILGSANVHQVPQVNRAQSEPVSKPHNPKIIPTRAEASALISNIGSGLFKYRML